MKSHHNNTTEPIIKESYKDLELPFDFKPLRESDDIKLGSEEPKQEIAELRQIQIDDENSFYLPVKLRYHGFLYHRICRGVKTYVYHQTLGKESISYEVFKVRVQQETILDGKVYPSHERWPKDEDFSKTAWTYWTLDQAMLKFNALEK